MIKPIKDERRPYDPQDPLMDLSIRMQVLANRGMFRPLEDRIRDLVRGVKSNNPQDRGDSDFPY